MGPPAAFLVAKRIIIIFKLEFLQAQSELVHVAVKMDKVLLLVLATGRQFIYMPWVPDFLSFFLTI